MLISLGLLNWANHLLQMIHDFGHKGVNNDFLISTQDALALCYNDHSPHENYHASAAFCLLLMPHHNFLSHLPKVWGCVVAGRWHSTFV
jgi:hypothetical protein